MSTHIGAEKGRIAETVLLPGDPLRAKFIAENYFEEAVCHNQVRGMLGYTGTYKGKRVSVQGTGMGIPSSLIYINELISEYGVKTLIRVGTAGAIQANVKVRDLVLVSSACTTSAINKTRFMGYDYAPTANFELLYNAYNKAKEMNLDMSKVHVGSILSNDEFYGHDEGIHERYAEYGVLAVEMESAGLYTIAAQHGARALGIMTISDHMMTGEETTSQEREQTFKTMMELALELAE